MIVAASGPEAREAVGSIRVTPMMTSTQTWANR